MGGFADFNETLRTGGEDAVRARIDRAQPYHADAPELPPDRSDLTVEAWRQRELPPRDYLLDGVMCTTSRWVIIGDTGVGKTLFGLELGFAVSSAASFLVWKGVRHARVMYLDGEMPAETLKERIEAAAAIYGNVDLIAYNRDVMGSGDMPPLNTPAGQVWLWKEIEAIKPDLIIFDSIMCLLIGPLSDEETWAPMKGLIRQLSSSRIAQVWLHHTGHDTSKGFGSKTKEWEMDTVAMLTKKEGDDGSLTLDFRKARLRTPKTSDLFKPQSIQRGVDGWTSGPGTIKSRMLTDRARKKAWFLQSYSDLAAVTTPEPGTGRRFVKIADIRAHMVQHGFLATDGGKIPGRERMAFSRAREELIQEGRFACDEVHFWETHPL
jgi:hypothetical protein